MPKPKPQAVSAARASGSIPNPGDPEEVLARGWIAFMQRLDPVTGDLDDEDYAVLRTGEDWVVETLLKLGFAAPDRAYEVGLRIVELSDDPWILENVGASVFEELLRRDGQHFIARLSADVLHLPRLRRAIADIAPNGLDPAVEARWRDLRQTLH
jgi:hypothetical protein